MSLPKATLLLDYKLVFGVKPPEDRLLLLGKLSKRFVLYELCGLNYKLKPKDKVYFDTSFNSQIEILKYYCLSNKVVYKKYASVAEQFTRADDDYPLIFNRPACIFGLEEVINSNLEDLEIPQDGYNVHEWEGLLKYLLAVNFELTKIKEINQSKPTFETLNPMLIALNENTIESHPVFTIYRGYNLIKFFIESEEFSKYTREYFIEKYGTEFEYVLFHIIGMNVMNKTNKPENEFFFHVLNELLPIFNGLSSRIPNKEIHKLLSIKKGPFIKDTMNTYLLADNTFLIEKFYSLFINDLWFDKIKPIQSENGGAKFNFGHYKAKIGYFIEQYLAEIFRNCFQSAKDFTLFLFDELKLKTNKGTIELSDIYLRKGNCIFLGQVKSGNIYDKEKFGGDIISLYKGNRNRFFEDYGVNQLYNSIFQINKSINKLDYNFKKEEKYIVYPSIIVQDKVFQTQLMPQIFNTRFQELLSNFNLQNIDVKPLLIIPIGALEELEMTLTINPTHFWELLDNNCKDTEFMSTFVYKIDNLNSIKEYPQRIQNLFNSLLQKYNPKIK